MLPLSGLGSPAAASPSKLFQKIAAIQSEANASLAGFPLTHAERVVLEPGKAGGEVAPSFLIHAESSVIELGQQCEECQAELLSLLGLRRPGRFERA